MGKISETFIHETVTEGISDAAHKQWKTKWKNKITELEDENESLKEQIQELKRQIKELKK